jgi:hypothetical protein
MQRQFRIPHWNRRGTLFVEAFNWRPEDGSGDALLTVTTSVGTVPKFRIVNTGQWFFACRVLDTSKLFKRLTELSVKGNLD